MIMLALTPASSTPAPCPRALFATLVTSRRRVHERRRREALASKGLQVRRLPHCTRVWFTQQHRHGHILHQAVPLAQQDLVCVHYTWYFLARPDHIMAGSLFDELCTWAVQYEQSTPRRRATRHHACVCRTCLVKNLLRLYKQLLNFFHPPIPLHLGKHHDRRGTILKYHLELRNTSGRPLLMTLELQQS